MRYSFRKKEKLDITNEDNLNYIVKEFLTYMIFRTDDVCYDPLYRKLYNDIKTNKIKLNIEQVDDHVIDSTASIREHPRFIPVKRWRYRIDLPEDYIEDIKFTYGLENYINNIRHILPSLTFA